MIAGIEAENAVSILHKKLGFRTTGTFRKSALAPGRWLALTCMEPRSNRPGDIGVDTPPR